MMEQLVLGIDLGGSKVDAAVVDSTNRIIGRGRVESQAWLGDEAVLQRIVEASRLAIGEASIAQDSISAIGIGSPGPLDPDTGYIIETANLPFRNFPLGPRLSDEFRCTVILDNDVNLGTYGEFRAGAARGAREVLGIFVGTGIGGGLIIDGHLHHGFTKNAGEVGHMIVRIGGPRCGCGRRGCLEALASRTAISRDLQKAVKRGHRTSLSKVLEKGPHSVTGAALAEAFFAGDRVARRLITRAGRYIGIGVGSLINLLGPEMVVLGGGVIEALGDEIITLIDNSARRTAFAFSMRGVRIVKAELGDDAGIIGAAVLARERLVNG